MEKPPFKTLFCECIHCPPEEYEEQAFKRCLYFHARFVAPLIRKINARFFDEDYKLLQYLGTATNWREINAEMLGFQDKNRYEGGLLRKRLRIRISGRKAAALAKGLFNDARRSTHQNGGHP